MVCPYCLLGNIPMYILVPLLIWTIFWKGIALWTSGSRKEKIWFICLFLINTVGILEIIYLLTRKVKKATKRRR
jgi:predicted permease